jgi:DNA-binding transcriptional regulator YiaG
MYKNLFDAWISSQPDLTEAEFARLIGQDRRLVNKWRRGINPPSEPAKKLIEMATKKAVTVESWGRAR